MSSANDIADSNPMQLFTYVAEQLNRFNLAYVHWVEGQTVGPRDIPADFSFLKLRQLSNSKYMANNGYDLPLALKARAENTADLICFGRPFIGNPDLVTRFYRGAALTDAPKDTWYGGGEHGYTDWPNL